VAGVRDTLITAVGWGLFGDPRTGKGTGKQENISEIWHKVGGDGEFLQGFWTQEACHDR
jgi:hypothetical protein